MEFTKHFLFPIHKEGLPYIIGAAAIALLVALYSGCAAFFLALLALAIALFFRDPERVTPEGDNLVISPADGIVTAVEASQLPDELNVSDAGNFTRVSIFLSVLDVHVNRVPATGAIKKLFYYPGKFLNATLDKASKENERQVILMETQKGEKIAFTQIAGLIARRIVCDLKEGDSVEGGERFGIIRFGSRMDVYVPEGVAIQAIVGQRMVGGESVIADLSEKGAHRIGVKH